MPQNVANRPCIAEQNPNLARNQGRVHAQGMPFPFP